MDRMKALRAASLGACFAVGLTLAGGMSCRSWAASLLIAFMLMLCKDGSRGSEKQAKNSRTDNQFIWHTLSFRELS